MLFLTRIWETEVYKNNVAFVATWGHVTMAQKPLGIHIFKHLCIRPLTLTYASLHHPSTHSDNDIDQTHQHSQHVLTPPASISELFVSSLAVCFIRLVASLFVNKGVSHGSSWLETLGNDVSSGQQAEAIAKNHGWPGNSVRQRVAALNSSEEIRLQLCLVPAVVVPSVCCTCVQW